MLLYFDSPLEHLTSKVESNVLVVLLVQVSSKLRNKITTTMIAPSHGLGSSALTDLADWFYRLDLPGDKYLQTEPRYHQLSSSHCGITGEQNITDDRTTK